MNRREFFRRSSVGAVGITTLGLVGWSDVDDATPTVSKVEPKYLADETHELVAGQMNVRFHIHHPLTSLDRARQFVADSEEFSLQLWESVCDETSGAGRFIVRTAYESYLRGHQYRRVIRDWQLVCDERNNPPSVIDEGSLVVDIYFQT